MKDLLVFNKHMELTLIIELLWIIWIISSSTLTLFLELGGYQARFLVVCEQIMNELGMNFFCILIVISDPPRHELWVRWAWTLWDNYLSLHPTKNSYEKFVRKWRQAGNKLYIT
jgi:hypothetical protein